MRSVSIHNMPEKNVEKIGFEISNLTPSRRYAMLISLIVSRPIAFITTLSDHGIVNAAPFSFLI